MCSPTRSPYGAAARPVKTQAIYSRYAITSRQDLKEGVAKLAVLHQADAAQPRQVIPLRAAVGERPMTEVHVNGHSLRVTRVSKISSKPGVRPMPTRVGGED